MCYRECIVFLAICKNIKEEENKIGSVRKYKYYKTLEHLSFLY